MTTVHALSRRSIDQLEDAIIDHSKRLNATEYEFLELVREFDIRQGWKAYHFNSCAEWLNLKCGIVVGTAREKVRVAMALFELPLESVRRLCCDASVVTVTQDAKGNPLDVGRKHRVVQPALRRALLARDRCCRYPGCTHRKWLDAHHVMHWVDGGKTSLENTLLLCDRHHRLLHEGGYRIRTDHRGELFFQTARGKVVV